MSHIGAAEGEEREGLGGARLSSSITSPVLSARPSLRHASILLCSSHPFTTTLQQLKTKAVEQAHHTQELPSWTSTPRSRRSAKVRSRSHTRSPRPATQSRRVVLQGGNDETETDVLIVDCPLSTTTGTYGVVYKAKSEWKR